MNVSLLRRGLVAAATVFLSTLVTAQAADPAPPVAPSAKSTAPGGAKADTKAESSYSVGLLLGTQLHNAGLGKDDTIYARAAGTVQFTEGRAGRTVSIVAPE